MGSILMTTGSRVLHSGNCSGPAAGPAEMPDNATVAMGLSIASVEELANSFSDSQVFNQVCVYCAICALLNRCPCRMSGSPQLMPREGSAGKTLWSWIDPAAPTLTGRALQRSA